MLYKKCLFEPIRKGTSKPSRDIIINAYIWKFKLQRKGAKYSINEYMNPSYAGVTFFFEIAENFIIIHFSERRVDFSRRFDQDLWYNW